MSDLLTQFDIVDRAEQARRRSGGSDEAILGGGGGGVRDSLNPFDDQELQSPVAAMQVSSSFCKVGLGAVAVVKELATGDVSKKPIITVVVVSYRPQSLRMRQGPGSRGYSLRVTETALVLANPSCRIRREKGFSMSTGI